ncbi:hypothetical protein Tco_0122074 [Tanacetum coccineum]
MTNVIKGEFEKLEDLKVKDASLTCDTSLEVFNDEFNQLSGMDDDLFTYEVEIRGDDEVELTDEEFSDNKDEVAKVFRIDTNIFDFETPMCKTFNEFNYLLQIDPDILTKDIEGFKTYKEYKDDWIYEWNKDIPWKNDGYCNGGNLPGAYVVGDSLNYQVYEWYKALKDSELKEQALRNKAIMEGLISDDESSNDCWRRWESHEITYHDHGELEYENETHDER